MSLRNTSLVFAAHSKVLPPRLPLGIWEVSTDVGGSYLIEPSGKLIRKDRITGTRWCTFDLSGSFTIAAPPLQTGVVQLYLVHVINGRVNIIESNASDTSPLRAQDCSWILDELDIDQSAISLSETYQDCLSLIAQAETDPGFKSGDRIVDALVGMALCRPDLLGGMKSREALEQLTEHQLKAISHWHLSI